MTDQTSEDELIEAELGLTLRGSDDGEITLRQVALGVGPLIIVVPDYDPERNVYSFDVDATDCGDPEELANTLETLATLLRSIPDADEINQGESVSGAPGDSDR